MKVPETSEILQFIRDNTETYFKYHTEEEIENLVDLYKILGRTFIVREEDDSIMAWGIWDELGNIGIVQELVVKKTKRGYRALKYLVALLKAKRQHLENIQFQRVAKNKPFKVVSIKQILRRRLYGRR